MVVRFNGTAYAITISGFSVIPARSRPRCPRYRQRPPRRRWSTPMTGSSGFASAFVTYWDPISASDATRRCPRRRRSGRLVLLVDGLAIPCFPLRRRRFRRSCRRIFWPVRTCCRCARSITRPADAVDCFVQAAGQWRAQAHNLALGPLRPAATFGKVTAPGGRPPPASDIVLDEARGQLYLTARCPISCRSIPSSRPSFSRRFPPTRRRFRRFRGVMETRLRSLLEARHRRNQSQYARRRQAVAGAPREAEELRGG